MVSLRTPFLEKENIVQVSIEIVVFAFIEEAKKGI
jgi:hypothetical protein